MQTLLLATHNLGKKREVQDILESMFTIKDLDDISLHISLPEETGMTYEQNALLKAQAVGDASKMLTIADDSGLEVGAFPGELGVHTARYAIGTDTDRNEKLLANLQGNNNRKARFICCIVMYDPATKQHNTFVGELQGSIAQNIRGDHGFGYDPVFIPDGYEKTNAELGEAIKNTISHRAQALAKLAAHLKKIV